MKSCVIHIDMEKGLLQNGEVLQQPLFSFPRERTPFFFQKKRSLRAPMTARAMTMSLKSFWGIFLRRRIPMAAPMTIMGSMRRSSLTDWRVMRP